MLKSLNTPNLHFKGIERNQKARSFSIELIKGNGFEVRLCKDISGNVIKRTILRSTQCGIKSITDYLKDGKFFRIERLNGIITQFMKQRSFPDNYFIKEIKDFITNLEEHKISHCKKGVAPKEISYIVSWNGQAPTLSFKNIDNKTQIPNLELLPVCISHKTKGALRQLSLYQIKAQSLENLLVPLAEKVTRENLLKLNPNLSKNEYFNQNQIKGLTDSETAQVYVINKQNDVFDFIDTLAHEYQHVRDIIDMERLDINLHRPKQGVKERALEQGVITSKHKEHSMLCEMVYEYRRYLQNCNTGNHDNMIIETRAIQKGLEVSNQAKQMLEKVKNLLEFKLF